MNITLASILLCGTMLTSAGGGITSAYAQDHVANSVTVSAAAPLHEKIMGKNKEANTIDLEFRGTVALSDTLTVEQLFGGTVAARTLNDVMVGAENVQVYLGEDGKASKIVIVGETPMNRMRVGIRKDISNIADMTQIDHSQIEIKSAQGFRITDKAANQSFDMTGDTLVTFAVDNGSIAVSKNGAEVVKTANRLYLEPVNEASLLQVMSISRVHGKPQYRGVFEVSLNPSKDKLRLINELDIEKYLYQVVPSEMPAFFGLEALKAQSIAARTYALTDFLTSRFADLGFHIDDSTLSQVYNNQAENALINQAIEATTGKIMKSGNELVDARFYSTSGGYGASKHEVWQDVDTNKFPGTPLPYLTGRSYTHDPANSGSLLTIDTSDEQALNAFYKNLNYTGYDSESPFFRWKVRLTKTELQNTINVNIRDRYAAEPMFILTKEADGSFVSKPIPEEGVGIISNMYVSRRGAGGNAMELVIEGSTGTYKILREFNIRFTIRPSKTYTGGTTDVLAYRTKGGTGVYDTTAVKNPSILYSAFMTFDLERDNDGVLTGVTFYGGGNGHGVGMSQNGAQFLGKLGWSYEQILDAYYKGMQLVDLNAPILRKIEISPKMVYVNPGAVHTFTVKGYDGSGNELEIPAGQVVWSHSGTIGTITAGGELTAANGAAVDKVTATAGAMSSEAVVVVGKPSALVEDFENMTDLAASSVRAVPNSVQLTQTSRPDPVQSGVHAGKLTYDFTGTTGTSAAYLNFKDELGGTGRVLEGHPKKLGIWVFGDGQRHWLRAALQDSASVKSTVDFTLVGGLNWIGWKYVTIDVPSNLKPPIRLNQIYIVELSDTNKNAGTLYFDQVTALYGNTDVFELELSGLTPMVIGDTKYASVYATYAGSTAPVKVPSGMTYYSSDPAVASIDSSGAVKAHKAGTTTITALYGNAQPAVYELKITAEAPVLERIELTGLSAMEVGQTAQAKVFATFAGDPSPIELPAHEVTFSSTQPEVATVDASGKVNALKAGQTAITAYYGGNTAVHELTVTNPVPILQSIELTGLNAMTIGDSQRTRVTAKYNLTQEPVELKDGIEFKSSNPQVASVDQTGTVTALKVGISMITASFGGKSDQFTVVVNKATSAPKRELRAAWIASVENIDWPKKGVVNADQQKQDFIAMLDELDAMGMNAVIVQIKPTADAFYPSEYGPWSEYLTGVQGQDPGYNPLAFMIEEAHKRNMEFHAWFNPYRISMKDKLENLVENHPARQHPDWVVSYGGKLYYNPGIPAVKDFVIGSIMEVVRGYDIDAVHMDDYFYPYVVNNKDFPDNQTYQAYGAAFANKGDWRRDNVNKLVSELSAAIKQEKSYVKFGISPFGVWRNIADDPTGSDTTAGQRNYDDLYADTRKWIQEEWIDYMTPQIYWNFGFTPAAYEKLIDWWTKETAGKNVHLYIGHAVYKINANNEAWENPDELPNQLKYNLNFEGVKGSMHFSAKDLLRNPLGIKDRLIHDSYKLPALIPAMSWLDSQAPGIPVLQSAVQGSAGNELVWKDASGGDGAYYVIYRFEGAQGGSIDNPSSIAAIVRKQTGDVQSYVDSGAVAGQLYTYAVTAVNRVHNESGASNFVTLGDKQNENSTILRGQSSVLTGQPFTLQFSLRNVVSSVYAQDITIEYDTVIADYVSAKSMKEGVKIVTEQASPGKVRFIVASQGPDQAVIGDTALIELAFTAKTVSQPTSGTFAVINALLGDEQGNEHKAQLSSFRMEVTTPPPGLPGDSTGDNKYSIGDLSFAAAHYGKDRTHPDWNRIQSADFDGNGVIDIKDLASIASKIIEQ